MPGTSFPEAFTLVLSASHHATHLAATLISTGTLGMLKSARAEVKTTRLEMARGTGLALWAEKLGHQDVAGTRDSRQGHLAPAGTANVPLFC